MRSDDSFAGAPKKRRYFPKIRFGALGVGLIRAYHKKILNFKIVKQNTTLEALIVCIFAASKSKTNYV